MSIIYVLIPIAVLLTAIGLYLFFWAVKTEQFDDLEKQGLSILFDDKDESTSNKNHELSNDNATDGTHTDKNNTDENNTDENSAYEVNPAINTSNKNAQQHPHKP